MFTTTSRKVLVPFATLVAAGAVAVGSGATFTSTTQSTVDVTSGTLVHSNTADTATLAVTELKPGESQSGSLTIANTGSLDSTLELDATIVDNGFETGALLIKITQDGVVVFAEADFSSLDTVDLGELNADKDGAGSEEADSTTLEVTVSMPDTAGNDNQGMNATATLSFVTSQVDDEESSVTDWLPDV